MIIRINQNAHSSRINTGIIAIILLLLLSVIFEEGVFTYFDEVAAVLAALILLFEFLSSRLKKKISRILLLLGLLILEGLISNFFKGPHRSLFIILVDVLTVCKPFLIVLAIVQISNEGSFDNVRERTQIFIKLFLGISMIFFVLNLFGIVSMTQETVFSIPNFKFFFGFPVSFAIFVYTLFLLLVDNNRSIFVQKYFWISIILICFTLKSQSLFFAIVLISLYLLVNRSKGSLHIKKVFFPVIVGALFAIPALINYFATAAYSPRKILLEDGINLARLNFPFGTGFSTFGSPIASQVYSPIYVEKGYYFLFGLGENGDTSFLSDMFLASIIGQFGIIGLLIFFFLILELLKLLSKDRAITNVNIVATAGLISVIAVTMASSFFTSSIGCFFLAIVALVISERKKNI